MEATIGSEELRSFRATIGVTRRQAAQVLGCSTSLVILIECGHRKLGKQRRARMAEAVAAFAVGGLEAVAALPAFRATRELKGPIGSEEAQDMRDYREEMGSINRREAAERLGITFSLLRAIEQGRVRINKRVRRYMEKDTGMKFVRKEVD